MMRIWSNLNAVFLVGLLAWAEVVDFLTKNRRQRNVH